MVAVLGFPILSVADSLELVSVERIWDAGGHNAFTDLIRFEDRWYCTFREADGHVRGDGKIRIIASEDGASWTAAGLLEESGIDLRDPKLSIAPDGRLMVVMGGSVYRDGQLIGRQPRVSFSSDGATWSAPQRVCEEGEWLWRVTWHDGRAYGVSYHSPKADGSGATVLVSEDGVHYKPIGPLTTPGRPNEVTLRFKGDTMLALARRGGSEDSAYFGSSDPPYKAWSWHDLELFMGGPDFVQLPDGRMIACGRDTSGPAKTVVGWLTPESFDPSLDLPSGGDTSYPGMVWHNGLLWISYYSSHEGKTNIYLAKVRVTP